MKKLLLIINILLLMCLLSAQASAWYYELSSEEISEPITALPTFPTLDFMHGCSSGAEAASPTWTNVANTSVTFVINPNGKAGILFTVAAKNNSSNGITVRSYLERKTLGLIWTKVDIGQKNNEWVDSVSGKYISGTHTVKLSEYGQYRVVLKITCGGDTVTETSEFKYASGYVPGDADGNNRLNAADARKILRFSAKLESYTSQQRKLCDLNSDGVITSSDARLALRMSAGLI